MNNMIDPNNKKSSRVGFHYFQDTYHYTNQDLQTWLPILKGLNTGWLVLKADADRAIPEYFLTGVLKAGITPIVDLSLSLAFPVASEQIEPLIHAYCDWGVEYFYCYDRPNQRGAWPASGWAQEDLIERFLDRFVPVANLIRSCGGKAIFPAFEPGGNYWDTAFLRAALYSLERRKEFELIDNLVLSAYAYTFGHSLNWGVGGPESWPESKPYFTPAQSQDQRGFRIFDWYTAITNAVIQKTLPIILLQAGLPSKPSVVNAEQLADDDYTETLVTLFHLTEGTSDDPSLYQDVQGKITPETLPENVLCCNFFSLSSSPSAEFSHLAWFNGAKPAFKAAQQLAKEYLPPVKSEEITEQAGILNEGFFRKAAHPIHHYLLIPKDPSVGYENQLRVALPFIQKHSPTVGSSLDEAQMAERVTILGDQKIFAREALVRLQRNGCQVDWISKVAR